MYMYAKLAAGCGREGGQKEGLYQVLYINASNYYMIYQDFCVLPTFTNEMQSLLIYLIQYF